MFAPATRSRAARRKPAADPSDQTGLARKPAHARAGRRRRRPPPPRPRPARGQSSDFDLQPTDHATGVVCPYDAGMTVFDAAECAFDDPAYESKVP